MSNLADTLRSQGDLPDARKLQEQALDAFRRILGSPCRRDFTATKSRQAGASVVQIWSIATDSCGHGLAGRAVLAGAMGRGGAGAGERSRSTSATCHGKLARSQIDKRPAAPDPAEGAAATRRRGCSRCRSTAYPRSASRPGRSRGSSPARRDRSPLVLLAAQPPAQRRPAAQVAALPVVLGSPEAVRQVAPELVAELGEPYGRLWELLVKALQGRV
jgi:Tetratricopeptide repeat